MKLRILIVFEDDYRAYRETIACALKSLRPHAEVATAELDALEAEIERVAPDLVICSRPKADNARDVLAWVELPCDPDQPATICLEGRCSEAAHLTLDALLSTVDTAEVLARDVSP